MCVADEGKNFWVFGTAKAGLQGGGRKGLLEAWKQARKQGLDRAIGDYPFRTGGRITVTVGEAIEQQNILYNEGLVDRGEWREEIIGKWLEAARELPGDMGVDNTVNQKYGDCAETVPITVIMQNYKGDVLSIALCPKELKDIKSISENFKPVLRSLKEHTGAKRACVNCLMLFAASEVNSGMKLKFYEDLGAWSMREAHYQIGKGNKTKPKPFPSPLVPIQFFTFVSSFSFIPFCLYVSSVYHCHQYSSERNWWSGYVGSPTFT